MKDAKAIKIILDFNSGKVQVPISFFQLAQIYQAREVLNQKYQRFY